MTSNPGNPTINPQVSGAHPLPRPTPLPCCPWTSNRPQRRFTRSPSRSVPRGFPTTPPRNWPRWVLRFHYLVHYRLSLGLDWIWNGDSDWVHCGIKAFEILRHVAAQMEMVIPLKQTLLSPLPGLPSNLCRAPLDCSPSEGPSIQPPFLDDKN